MRDSAALYKIAEKKNIPIIPFPLPETGSLCVQEEGTGKCCIGIDEPLLKSEKKKKVHLGHELGHCLTGSFYNKYALCDIRQKQENKANKWAVQALIPEEALDDAVAEGYTNIPSLAEHFEVTEDFMRLAVCWYVHGNMTGDLDF